MITFLFGRPGSGKTAYMIEEIKKSIQAGKKTYFLVPEQQAFISECMLADLPPSSALLFEVVSFSRLCELAFEEHGGLTDGRAGSGVRSLLMWQNLREVSPFLREYGKCKPDRALTSLMLSTVDELRASSVSPEDCEKVAAGCEGALRDKMLDIALVYANLQRLLSERLGEGELLAENKLSRLAELLRKTDCFSGCCLYVDSFTSFTGEEHAILELLMSRADDFCISFASDAKKPKLHTESVCETARRFCRYAKEQQLNSNEVILTENRRTESQELQILERHLWNFSLTPKTVPVIPPKNRGALTMTVCANEYEEAYFAALEILKAKEAGIKFSEMALIMRELDSRKGILDAVFESLHIPYFYSEKTDLSATPVSRLVLSALRCVAFNYRAADVMTLLKTGLCGIDPHDADLFEDYCFTWSIEGSRFTGLKEPWSMNPDGYTTDRSPRGEEILSAANRVREQLIAPLLTLQHNLIDADGNSIAGCRALYSYLKDIALPESLAALAEFSLSTGELREAGELLRVYDFLVSALTDIATVMAEDRMGAEELAGAIEIMLSDTDIGSVPAVGEYVTVGSAATLRVENIKVAILLGLCEGEFPKGYSDAGLLTENDKMKLSELSLSLDSREYRITSDELFHVYRAMTKPSKKLILSTVISRVGGGALTPSSAWNRCLFLFPYLTPQEFSLSRIRSLVKAETAEVPVIKAEEADAEYNVVKIDPLYVRMLFGERLHLTKSRISSFVECPYKYWCDYVLRLREQTKAAVSYADAGTMIHYVLEKLLSSLRQPDGRLCEISEAETVSEVNRLLTQYVNSIACPLSPSMIYSFSRIRDLSLIMVKSVIDEFKQSDFRILAFEKSISDRGQHVLSPMEIQVDPHRENPVVSLGGVIDRIDCYDGEDGRYLRIIDYKTGSHRFDVEKVANGADLQLPAYLFTAILEKNRALLGNADQLIPASALFLSAEESGGMIAPVRSGFLLGEEAFLRAASHEMDKKILAGTTVKKDGSLGGKSALSREGIAEINATLQNTVAATARNMYAGRAPRTPSKEACAFCSMKGSCPVACKE